MRFTLALLAIIALLFVACEEDTAVPGKPSVTATPIENGAKLRLSWTAVTDAEEYVIYIDGSEDTIITGLSIDIAGPAKEVAVTASNSAGESGKWTLDLTPVSTTSLVVYGISDPEPTHPSGINFTSDGTAVGISVSSSAADVDFYLDDVNFGDGMWFASPKDAPNPINSRGNVVEENATTDFDALDIAAAPGGAYLSRVALSGNDVRSIWLDRNDNNYDVTDYFGKIKIVSIETATAKVTLNVAFQKVPGLRWVVTP